jgi:hypothetical protein
MWNCHRMTSANIVNFTIFRDGLIVGKHRQNLLCKSRKHELAKYQPAELYQIQAHGLDENEAPWTENVMNLQEFLSRA